MQVKLLGEIRTDKDSVAQEVQIIYRYAGNYTPESGLKVRLEWVILILVSCMLY